MVYVVAEDILGGGAHGVGELEEEGDDVSLARVVREKISGAFGSHLILSK